jgi:hypothetical protein
MSDRATCWSVTINNPVSADDDNIARARQKSGWKVEGQLEEGENGTKHYQLMVKTPQTRFSALKSAFPRAHIEVARNAKALGAYVHKEDTRISELPTSDKFPTMDKFWLLFTGYIIDTDRIEDLHEEPEDRLDLLDEFVLSSINDGYHVESFGVNPQIRSAIKKYGHAIFRRSKNIIRRQETDRQTALISEVESIVENGEESESDESEVSEESTSTCSSE